MEMRGIEATWVVIGDGVSDPIRHGAVVVGSDGVLIAVGDAHALRDAHRDATWESRDAVLLPGLVDGHTHLELSALRGQVPGGKGFVPWAIDMLSKRSARGVDGDDEAIVQAISELVAFGTAAVGDVSNSLGSVQALAGLPIVARVFAEVFGVRRDTAQTMLRTVTERMAALGTLPPNVTVTLAPHTPYTLPPDMLAEICRRVRDAGALSTIHLAEHAAERAFLRDGSGPFRELIDGGAPDWDPPGTDPVRHAAAHGAVGPHMLAVHLTDARDDELALIAAAKMPVVLCPRSNLHIEVRLPPLESILAHGIRPALGTDSLASSPDLDVLGEARALRARFANVRPRALVAMATGWGADALRVSDRVGRLVAGLAPGAIAFPHSPSAIPSDPEAWVLSGQATTRHILVPPGSRGFR